MPRSAQPRPPDDLLSLGPGSRGWLKRVGIASRADLRAVGAVEAYHRVKALGVHASLNLLYAMHAALLDLHWTMLPSKVRADLERQAKEAT